MKALFIGRFQPFHIGHLKVILEASKKYKKIIIGIGSSQYCNTIDNPFTYEERKLMIDESLKNNGIKNYSIVSIPDIHNPPKWVDHVRSIISDFDIVLSNNDFTRHLFSEKEYDVKKLPLYKKEKFSGKVIRSRIRNNETWENLVPKEVFNIIKKINGENRVKQL